MRAYAVPSRAARSVSDPFAISFPLRRLVPRSCSSIRLGFPGIGHYRHSSSSAWIQQALKSTNGGAGSSRVRNIGIIAHIDAGKTTTTERMLYYSGHTHRIGNVDEGSTVTDFLPAERARGITIQSAAITFPWPPTASSRDALKSGQVPPDVFGINLIDTPGHADFTFEVVRSLRVLDGAVCILDGVAGVEAQTENVWLQARSYRIPTIIYVNKLDREGAAYGAAIRDVAMKLAVWPAVCHLPWYDEISGRFQGVMDVVLMQALKWAEGGDGKDIETIDMDRLQAQHPRLAQEAEKARTALVETLAEHDEIMVERFLEHDEDHLAIPPSELIASLRRCLLAKHPQVVPVFAGASFRNVGVQPVLDAIAALLPSPQEAARTKVDCSSWKGDLQSLMSPTMELQSVDPSRGKRVKQPSKKPMSLIPNHVLESCALAFKVVADPRHGVLVYVRVYHGRLARNALLFNTSLQQTERSPHLLRMYGSETLDIHEIQAGQIGVIAGLKLTRTGDTLVTWNAGFGRQVPPVPLNELRLRPIHVPPPVFFASVEPASLSEEAHLEAALKSLLREDPSLHVTTDEDTGQTLLSGMGDLHLEIARDRLTQDLRAKAHVGKIEISYRETLSCGAGPIMIIQDFELAGKSGKAGCIASVQLLDEHPVQTTESTDWHRVSERDGNVVTVQIMSPETMESDIGEVFPPHLDVDAVFMALQHGALGALAAGPHRRFPVHGVHVALQFDISKHLFGAVTSLSAIVAAARQATKQALRAAADKAPPVLMEPVMNVVLTVDEGSLGAVVHDLSASRGGHVLSLDEPGRSASYAGDDGPFSSNDNDDNSLSHTESEDQEQEQPQVDLGQVYSPPDPYQMQRSSSISDAAGPQPSRSRSIVARVPLKEMVGYLKHLRSLTAGRGSFTMSVDKYERMTNQREKAAFGGFSTS